MIPRDPSWCSRCIAPERDGRAEGEPCDDHRGPDGWAVPYDGPDAYEPSAWVRETVGQRFFGLGDVYECFGYDPREGFWMRGVDGDRRETNVSERAIGRTYHPVRMTWGAHRLLAALAGHSSDVGGVDTAAALETLRRNGFVDRGGSINDAGRAAAKSASEEAGA